MMKDGLLHRLSKRPSGEELTQLVLPSEFREVVLMISETLVLKELQTY